MHACIHSQPPSLPACQTDRQTDTSICEYHRRPTHLRLDPTLTQTIVTAHAHTHTTPPHAPTCPHTTHNTTHTHTHTHTHTSAIDEALDRIPKTPANAYVIRKIRPLLPSYAGDYTVSVPFTRIRDMAHGWVVWLGLWVGVGGCGFGWAGMDISARERGRECESERMRRVGGKD